MRWRLQGAQLGQVEHQRPGTPGANAGDTAVPGLALAPDGTGTQGRVQVIGQGRQTLREPGDMRLEIRLDPRRGAAQAVGLRRAHGHELPAPGQERPQGVGLCGRQRARSGPDRLGTVRQGARVEPIRLGQLTRGFRKVPRVPGIDDDHREAAATTAR